MNKLRLFKNAEISLILFSKASIVTGTLPSISHLQEAAKIPIIEELKVVLKTQPNKLAMHLLHRLHQQDFLQKDLKKYNHFFS